MIDFHRLRELNPINRTLEEYGIEVDRKGFAHCPFHREKTASFKVYPDNSYYCFGCHEHGDVISLVMKLEGTDFKGAYARLDRNITYSEQRKIERIKRQREAVRTQRELALSGYFAAFDAWKENEDRLALFAPEGPDKAPGEVFLYLLGRREPLSFMLDCAEIKLYGGGERK